MEGGSEMTQAEQPRTKVMVTGGAGFVGRELVRALAPVADVLVADLLRYGAPDWLSLESPVSASTGWTSATALPPGRSSSTSSPT